MNKPNSDVDKYTTDLRSLEAATSARVGAFVRKAWITVVGPLLVSAIGLAIAYAIWPTGITDLPLGSITLGQALRAIASVIVGILLGTFAIQAWLDL